MDFKAVTNSLLDEIDKYRKVLKYKTLASYLSEKMNKKIETNDIGNWRSRGLVAYQRIEELTQIRDTAEADAVASVTGPNATRLDSILQRKETSIQSKEELKTLPTRPGDLGDLEKPATVREGVFFGRAEGAIRAAEAIGRGIGETLKRVEARLERDADDGRPPGHPQQPQSDAGRESRTGTEGG
jgi:hypothetical protein